MLALDPAKQMILWKICHIIQKMNNASPVDFVLWLLTVYIILSLFKHVL